MLVDPSAVACSTALVASSFSTTLSGSSTTIWSIVILPTTRRRQRRTSRCSRTRILGDDVRILCTEIINGDPFGHARSGTLENEGPGDDVLVTVSGELAAPIRARRRRRLGRPWGIGNCAMATYGSCGMNLS